MKKVTLPPELCARYRNCGDAYNLNEGLLTSFASLRGDITTPAAVAAADRLLEMLTAWREAYAEIVALAVAAGWNAETNGQVRVRTVEGCATFEESANVPSSEVEEGNKEKVAPPAYVSSGVISAEAPMECAEAEADEAEVAEPPSPLTKTQEKKLAAAGVRDHVE